MTDGTKYGTETSYHSISSTDNEMNDEISNRPKIELGNHPQMQDNRSWLSTAFWQTVALLWLVPVVALLYLNFANFVIGASAWCPGGKCYLNAFNLDTAVPQSRMKNFDKEDHNLLGGLQFVAKGLEVWFGIIAAALVYLITMRIAGKQEGLPVAYLTRPMEFADVVALLDPLLWVTGPSPLGVKPAGEKKLGRRVWALIALSVFLCILINLMGPATAVLVIPALQWIETGYVGTRQFLNLNAAHPPMIGLESWLWWSTAGTVCSNEDYLAHNYSCTQTPFGDALDTWTQTAIGIGGASTGFTTQSDLTFQTNMTYQSSTTNSYEQLVNSGVFSNFVWWAPSRQIISNLSIDQSVVASLSFGLTEQQISNGFASYNYYPDPVETYVEYNKSLELQIRRNGPVVGTMMNKFVDYNNQWHYSIDVDAGRQVRCYVGYKLYNAQMTEGVSDVSLNYTKCIRTGTGWSEMNKKASFSAAGEYNTITRRQGPGVTVDIFSSDRAVFLPNGTLPSWFPGACLAPGGRKVNSTTCDWNRLFTTDITPDLANRTQNVNTIEFNMRNGNFSTTMTADFTAYLAFTNYTLDPFRYTNPLGLVQTDNLPTTGKSFPIDPAWLLVGWSVGEGGTLLANRTTTNLLLDVMSRLLVDTTDNVVMGLTDDQQDYKIDYVSFLPIMHTLSLIDHSTTLVPEGTKTTDENRPVLLRNGRMYVWAYGLGSRTSYLGAAVAIAGCLVVVWQFVLGFIDRRRYRSPTQLVVAALEHSPRGEFEGKQHDENAMARVSDYWTPCQMRGPLIKNTRYASTSKMTAGIAANILSIDRIRIPKLDVA